MLVFTGRSDRVRNLSSPSARLQLNAVISIAHSQSSSRGKGPPHFWLRPERVLICKIQISKYLGFCFPLEIKEERRVRF